jgi:DUF1680 family protein
MITSRKEVSENEGKIAFQRGPLVYCVEGADNQGRAMNIIADGTPEMTIEKGQILEETVLMLTGKMTAVEIGKGGTSIITEKRQLRPSPITAGATAAAMRCRYGFLHM